MQRDGDMKEDDTVSVVLDPVADGRRGYIFQIIVKLRWTFRW